jgi:hypothetical protein
MAKITALPVAEEIVGIEHLPIVQDGTTKRMTMAAFREIITPYLQNWYRGEPGESATTVRDHGAVHDDGTTPQQLYFSAAAQSVPGRITTPSLYASIPQPLSAEVWVPDGLYHLTDDVDSGGKSIAWRCDDGARFTPGSEQYLLGKVIRQSRVSNGFIGGFLDHAAVRSASGGGGAFDAPPQVFGITSPDQIALIPTADGVGCFADFTGVPLTHRSAATFTATTAILSTPARVKRLRRGMLIQTTHSPWHRGLLVDWSGDGRVLEVLAWKLEGTTTSVTPADTAEVLVNVVHKGWARNSNAILTASGYTYQATVHEMGILNAKVQPVSAEAELGRTWGDDVVNLGPYKFSIGFIARGPGYEGFRATGTDIGFNSAAFASLGYAAPLVGFNYDGANIAFQQRSPTGATQLTIANGAIEIGDLTKPSTPFIDFHSSGAAGYDYDVRMIALAGGEEGRGARGTLQIAGAEVVVPQIRPAQDNAGSNGTPAYRWTVIWAATGTISTSDPRLKRFIHDDEFMAKLRRIAGRLRPQILPYQWLEELAKKGDGARIHIGASAQVVMDEFGFEGLNARDFGLFCEDPEIETVEVIEYVDVPDTQKVQEPRLMPEVEDDRVVMRERMVEVDKPKTRRLPVFNNDNTPMTRKVYAEGKYGQPVWTGEYEDAFYDAPVMRKKEVVTYVQRPTGETRQGIRYEQLAMLMLAAA